MFRYVKLNMTKLRRIPGGWNIEMRNNPQVPPQRFPITPLEPMLGNKEISVRTGLPKPTVSRLTYTLTKLGYLRHNMRLAKYQLGSAALSIGYPLLASMSIRQIARPFMKELADYVHGSVNMGIRDRLNMVYVEACRSGNLTTLPDIGTSVPIAQSVEDFGPRLVAMARNIEAALGMH